VRAVEASGVRAAAAFPSFVPADYSALWLRQETLPAGRDGTVQIRVLFTTRRVTRISRVHWARLIGPD
jgi:hypothetical protein